MILYMECLSVCVFCHTAAKTTEQIQVLFQAHKAHCMYGGPNPPMWEGGEVVKISPLWKFVIDLPDGATGRFTLLLCLDLMQYLPDYLGFVMHTFVTWRSNSFLGCVECMACRLMLPMLAVSVHPSVTRLSSVSLCKNGRTDEDPVCGEHSLGPREHCVRRGSCSPHSEGRWIHQITLTSCLILLIVIMCRCSRWWCSGSAVDGH